MGLGKYHSWKEKKNLQYHRSPSDHSAWGGCVCVHRAPYLVYLPVDKGGRAHLFICSCCMPNGHVPSGGPACAACLKGEDWEAMALSRCFRTRNVTMRVNMSTGATSQKTKQKTGIRFCWAVHIRVFLLARVCNPLIVYIICKNSPSFHISLLSVMPNTPPTLHTLCFICKFPHIWGKNTVILFKPAYILICFQHNPPQHVYPFSRRCLFLRYHFSGVTPPSSPSTWGFFPLLSDCCLS